MRATSFERRLLSVYKQAIWQRNWVVADHLLSAIEACAPTDATIGEIVVEAYCGLAASAIASQHAQPKGSKQGA